MFNAKCFDGNVLCLEHSILAQTCVQKLRNALVLADQKQ
jgi:hypothetical protein